MSNFEANGNIPTLTAGQVVKTLTNLYGTAIGAALPLRDVPAVMLWGPPGVGKSQAVGQVARALQEQTGRRAVVTDVELALYNPIDLRGIPTANEDKTAAVWLRPQVFQMDADPSVVNILFLDELSAAPPSVQAAAYQLVLNRAVGEHCLPDNCVVVAAGNRTTDRSVAYKMPRALANRMMHLQVQAGFDAWRRWAIEQGINPRVIGYLSFRQDALVASEQDADSVAFATPRTWEMVSTLLNCDDDVERQFLPIAGLVGMGAAAGFRSWNEVCGDLPRVEDIFAGLNPPVPRNPDALYALVASMATYAREHKDDLALIERSIEYARAFPPDFSVVLMEDYRCIEEGYLGRLMGLPAFVEWLGRNGGLMNGSL